MKHLVLAVALLVPAPALADFDCTITRQCGGGTCEAFTGGPLLVEEAGDVWQISLGGQTWEGFSTSILDTGELSIVIPPQNGMSGLVSIYPSGGVSFTAHAFGDGPVAITGEGTCTGEGG